MIVGEWPEDSGPGLNKIMEAKKKLSKSELATLVQIVFRRHWRDAKWICLRQDRRFKWRKHWLWGKHDARRIYLCLFTNLDNGKEWTDTQFGYRVCRVIFIILAPPPWVLTRIALWLSQTPSVLGKKWDRQSGTCHVRVWLCSWRIFTRCNISPAPCFFGFHAANAHHTMQQCNRVCRPSRPSATLEAGQNCRSSPQMFLLSRQGLDSVRSLVSGSQIYTKNKGFKIKHS